MHCIDPFWLNVMQNNLQSQDTVSTGTIQIQNRRNRILMLQSKGFACESKPTLSLEVRSKLSFYIDSLMSVCIVMDTVSQF